MLFIRIDGGEEQETSEAEETLHPKLETNAETTDNPAVKTKTEPAAKAKPTSTKPDNTVKGIGPKVNAILNEMGITSVEQFAA